MTEQQKGTMDKHFFRASAADFKKIPGSPVAYWTSSGMRSCYSNGRPFGEVAPVKLGMRTGDNDKWLRRWHEVPATQTNTTATDREDAKASQQKWFPYNKGGEFRRWYGNNEYLIFWDNDGYEIKKETLEKYPQLSWDNLGWKITNESDFFAPALTWSFISSAYFGVRAPLGGALLDVAGSSAFPPKDSYHEVAGFLCSKLAFEFLKLSNPTLNFQVVNVNGLPWIAPSSQQTRPIVEALIAMSKSDWDAYERSWDFQSLPLLGIRGEGSGISTDKTSPLTPRPSTLSKSYTAWITQNRDAIAEMKRLEEENNSLFIDAYGLADELTPDVPIEQITLTVNPAYRYGGKLTVEEQWDRFRQDTMEELVSYAIGCMMGRYSLDEPGLIYAHSGNEGFAADRYKTFPADDDGIVPITDMDWFDDDAAKRVREFLLVAWGEETIEENMEWLAEVLGKKAGETPEETIRRYLSAKFFKDHLKTYKKRPIYWLFSSGKAKAFEYLDNEVKQASSTSAQRKLQKELNNLKKKQIELAKFDEELRHYADQRISIDLDDGVKVNYGKFGGLLAEVKAVTGEK